MSSNSHNTLFLLILLLGCGEHPSGEVLDTLETIELEPGTNSALILCDEDEAEYILHVDVSANPDWSGHSWDFPLKSPSFTEHHLNRGGYVCSIGPNGFFGSVLLGDSNEFETELKIGLTYDKKSDRINRLRESVRLSRPDGGQLRLEHGWVVDWRWESVTM